MPKKVDEQGKKHAFDLANYKAEIIAAWNKDETSIVLDGRKFNLRLKNLSNVDYIIVSPEAGPVPTGNLILNELQFRQEMERRQAPISERKPRPQHRQPSAPSLHAPQKKKAGK